MDIHEPCVSSSSSPSSTQSCFSSSYPTSSDRRSQDVDKSKCSRLLSFGSVEGEHFSIELERKNENEEKDYDGDDDILAILVELEREAKLSMLPLSDDPVEDFVFHQLAGEKPILFRCHESSDIFILNYVKKKSPSTSRDRFLKFKSQCRTNTSHGEVEFVFRYPGTDVCRYYVFYPLVEDPSTLVAGQLSARPPQLFWHLYTIQNDGSSIFLMKIVSFSHLQPPQQQH